MDEIDIFLRKHPKDEGTFAPASETTIRKYTGKVPDFLIEMWKADGFCSFNNGFFWLVNPDDLLPEAELVADLQGVTPMVRTGLGGIIFEQGGTCHSFDPAYLDITTYEEFSLADLLNFSVTADESLNEYYYFKLYEKARKRLGPITYDECYGFVPAIALGGDLSADNLQKVELKSYLQILSQLE